jgi:hypothetical protein
MDTYREHPSDFDLPAAAETAPADDVAAAIGSDERRMHVRAYNYWVSLLEGRDFPSIEDLEPNNLQDFSACSVLLDFTCGIDNPALPYIGTAIRDECGLNDDTRDIGDVPSRSLLSRLTDHYMQIIANRAPVGFEAEFENQRNETICYRGILMPFSSDGDTIDFIYGVINWKKGEGAEATPPQIREQIAAVAVEPVQAIVPHPELPSVEFVEEEPEAEQPFAQAPHQTEEFAAENPAEHEAEQPVAWAQDEVEDIAAEIPAEHEAEPVEQQLATPIHFSWEDGPLANEDDAPVVELDANAGLADRLWAARETAEAVKAGEGRTRAALYKALALAYDFAIAAESNPHDYAELLEESGVKAQARAPMTPIVKLVFGIDYDKARLTEFASALCYAQRQSVELGGFQPFIEKQPGGLKALVAAQRQARRPEPKADSRGEAARARLRSAPAISLADLQSDEEFAVVVTRRGADGRHEPVAIIADETLVERAIRNAR